MKAPLPYCAANPGKRRKLPRPTALPATAMITPMRELQPSFGVPVVIGGTFYKARGLHASEIRRFPAALRARDWKAGCGRCCLRQISSGAESKVAFGAFRRAYGLAYCLSGYHFRSMDRISG